MDAAAKQALKVTLANLIKWDIDLCWDSGHEEGEQTLEFMGTEIKFIVYETSADVFAMYAEVGDEQVDLDDQELYEMAMSDRDSSASAGRGMSYDEWAAKSEDWFEARKETWRHDI